MIKEIAIDKEVVEKYNALMRSRKVDFVKEGINPGEVVIGWDVYFNDGISCCLDVVSSDDNCLWCQCVWFKDGTKDCHGDEYACSNVSEILDGTWNDGNGNQLIVNAI